MTTPSSDLRQAQPHKPVLTLCNRIIFKAQGPPIRNVDECNEKMMMEEHGGVWRLLITQRDLQYIMVHLCLWKQNTQL